LDPEVADADPPPPPAPVHATVTDVTPAGATQV